jgi:hypothetical protein
MKAISISILVISFLIIIDQFLPKRSFLFFLKKNASRSIWLLRAIPFILAFLFLYLIIGRNLFPYWELFENVPFDIKKFQYLDDLGLSANLQQKILLTLNPLVFSLPPVVLFLTIFSWLQASFKKNSSYFFHIFSLSVFIFSFYAAYIAMDIAAIVRYSILIFPLVSFLAALGLWQLSLRFKGNDEKNRIFLTFLLMILSLISLISIKPFYFNYSNALLPKSSIISDAWGYGGYQAAEFLNGLPDSENLTIWSDYYGVCEFFKGKCLTDYDLLTGKYSIDYYVLTRRGKIRYLQNPSKWMPENGVKALPYYDRTDPVWELEIDDRPDNYIKIFKSS